MDLSWSSNFDFHFLVYFLGTFLHDVMADDTTTPSYWLNWRFLVCAVWVVVAMVLAAFLIWRHEGRREDEHEAAGCLYGDEVWGTCSKSIHPIWLLAYRLLAFSALLALLLANLITSGSVKYYFYTEWTFTLVTFYFGLGSSLSIHGSLRCRHEVEPDRDSYISTSAEHGSYVPPQLGEHEDMPSQTRSSNCRDEPNCRTAASIFGYILQIVFQMSAGAVMLTDSVFWLVLYPSLIARGYRLSFLIVCKHSVNAIFLLGDAILNRLRFPFFRMAYFVLWTCMFVLFQWIIHVCVSIRWPYPFMDLSSPYAPLWYLGIGLLAFLCYGICFFIFRVKQCYLSR
ncbi:uncharacterized protein LOC130993623 isoform X2 [Salvia miltiorrhiza]|uniref:uncharacterized protein LOC130993623 isoform X2 n=1 Tax=Salvia miltiorrhiza TaxID=226208 RepID=UPI0025AD7EA4|nr:uncharacterized protein LOC130993623 isoform X2 [Salvia miltiorrhiza]